MSAGAYKIAEKCCREYLAAIDDTTEKGLSRIGSERFERMVLSVEKALEKYDPKEEAITCR